MDQVDYYCPFSGEKLQYYESKYLKNKNKSYKIINTIPRFCPIENYSESFGFQWNLFDKTQLDTYSGSDLTSERFWNETKWDPKSLTNMRVLEVGCGAGRFSEVFLKKTKELSINLIISFQIRQISNMTACHKWKCFINK